MLSHFFLGCLSANRQITGRISVFGVLTRRTLASGTFFRVKHFQWLGTLPRAILSVLLLGVGEVVNAGRNWYLGNLVQRLLATLIKSQRTASHVQFIPSSRLILPTTTTSLMQTCPTFFTCGSAEVSNPSFQSFFAPCWFRRVKNWLQTRSAKAGRRPLVSFSNEGWGKYSRRCRRRRTFSIRRQYITHSSKLRMSTSQQKIPMDLGHRPGGRLFCRDSLTPVGKSTGHGQYEQRWGIEHGAWRATRLPHPSS